MMSARLPRIGRRSTSSSTIRRCVHFWTADQAWAEFETSGRIKWASDLADIPAKYGVTNVYADLGTSFANSAVAHPKFCAAFVATLVKGLGDDHVVWGTDAVWYGSPQWQIEAMRRLEIPEDMQKKYGFASLGDANGAIKQAIFGLNSARLYRLNLKAADALRCRRTPRIGWHN